MTKLAIVQMQLSDDREQNVIDAIGIVTEAAEAGANIILLPELFEGHYFPQVERETYFRRANPVEKHPFLPKFQALAKKLGCVLPISFFERSGQAYFNSLIVFDADGSSLGVYRKSHIPDGPGYEEKYYFNPGDTGFKVFHTQFGTIGVGICWDQWYPECARCLALMGAGLLLYPTAIGSEPSASGGLGTKEMWQRVMIGHAVANCCYVGAANRIASENVEGLIQTYYGSSFISDYMGNNIQEATVDGEAILYAEIDLDEAASFRAGMGFFRDRRPELYTPLLTLDGNVKK